MRHFINIINEAAASRPPLPQTGETPWWIEALAPLTAELHAEHTSDWGEWTWTTGGCFAFADRFQKAYGGQLWAMARNTDADYWDADHAVIQVNGVFYDYNGVFDPNAYAAMLAAQDRIEGQGPFERKMLPKRSVGWFEDEFLNDEQWSGLARVLRTGKPYGAKKAI